VCVCVCVVVCVCVCVCVSVCVCVCVFVCVCVCALVIPEYLARLCMYNTFSSPSNPSPGWQSPFADAPYVHDSLDGCEASAASQTAFL